MGPLIKEDVEIERISRKGKHRSWQLIGLFNVHNRKWSPLSPTVTFDTVRWGNMLHQHPSARNTVWLFEKKIPFPASHETVIFPFFFGLNSGKRQNSATDRTCGRHAICIVIVSKRHPRHNRFLPRGLFTSNGREEMPSTRRNRHGGRRQKSPGKLSPTYATGCRDFYSIYGTFFLKISSQSIFRCVWKQCLLAGG